MANHSNIQTLTTEMYKVKNDLAPEIVSNFFCLQKQCQYDWLYDTVGTKSVYHSSDSISYLGPKSIRNWIPQKCPCRLFKVVLDVTGFVNINSDQWCKFVLISDVRFMIISSGIRLMEKLFLVGVVMTVHGSCGFLLLLLYFLLKYCNKCFQIFI